MPDHWQSTTIGEACDILDRQRKPVSSAERAKRLGPVPYYGATGIAGWIDEPIFDEPLVLLGEDAVDFASPAASKAYSIDGPSWVNNHAHVLRPKKIFINCLMLELLLNAVDYTNYAVFGTRSKLTQASMKSIRLVVPPLSEQRRIVDLVGSIDNYIDALEKQIDATRTARQGVLSELLSNPGDNWQWTTLGKAFEIRMGRQRSPKNASGPHMVKYLRAANIKDGQLLLDDVKEMNFSPEEQATFSLKSGDVLVTEGCGSRTEIGASAKWDSEISGVVCFQNTLLRMRSVEGVSCSAFAEVVARYFYSSGRWAEISSGTNIFHIGAKRAEAMPINLPPAADQQQIVGLIGSFDEQISALETQIAAARETRSGVLSELLSGDRLLDESYDKAVGW